MDDIKIAIASSNNNDTKYSISIKENSNMTDTTSASNKVICRRDSRSRCAPDRGKAVPHTVLVRSRSSGIGLGIVFVFAYNM